MAKNAAETVICALIKEVRNRLDEADAVVEAANGLSKRGQANHALRTLMDFEGPSHEANDLFRAALTIQRHLLAPKD
jgi:hypothetical protein